MFKTGYEQNGYHHDINYKNFENRLTEMLVSKLNKNSAVVIDNVCCHNIQKS